MKEVPYQKIFNKAVERVILSSLIFQPEFIEDYISEIDEDDFYFPFHRDLFSAMVKLVNSKKIVTEELLKEELEKEGKFQEEEFLNILLEEPVTKLEYYIKELKNKSTKRKFLLLAKEIENAILEQDLDSSELIDFVESQVYKIGQNNTIKDFKNSDEAVELTKEYIEKMKNRENKSITGVDTGFFALNKMTTGFNPGDLVIIAARPAMGKTAFSLNIVYHSLKQGNGVAFFSLEMPVEQLMLRLFSIDSLIELQKLRTGDLSDAEWQMLYQSMEKFRNYKLFIDDDSGININQLKTKLRKLKSKNPEIGLAVIDYIQIMGSTGSKDRQAEVSEISRGLKLLARELNIPILALSQLNRSLEARTNKRPIMSDIRESGCLAGDTLIFNTRENRYVRLDTIVKNRDTLLPLPTYGMDENRNIREFNIINGFFSGVKLVYLLSTSSHQIRATIEHKFYTSTGWKELGDIQIGEEIAIFEDGKVAWEKVVSIDEVGNMETFDLTIEEVHNFIANGIVAHNSIEQDADIILFVYRDDVYKLKAEKEKEKEAKAQGKKYIPQIEEKSEEVAEIIIGKQRNGPTGVVKLNFIKYQTRFVDITDSFSGIDEEIQTSTKINIDGDMVDIPPI